MNDSLPIDIEKEKGRIEERNKVTVRSLWGDGDFQLITGNTGVSLKAHPYTTMEGKLGQGSSTWICSVLPMSPRVVGFAFQGSLDTVLSL